MLKSWDYDVPEVDLWKEVYRVLKPGGHILSFAGSRTYHRMAVNIEDAGFEIRDMLGWLYGSGFPKSHNIGKAIDKNNGQSKIELKFVKWYRTVGISAKETNKIIGTKDTGSHYLRLDQPYLPTKESWRKLKPHIKKEIPYWVDELIKRVGAEREIIEKKRVQRNSSSWNGGGMLGVGEQNFDITIPKTEQAKQWEGWGTALKPAHEPIVMARKPFNTSVAENVLTHGTGGINIDECRVGTDENLGREHKNCLGQYGSLSKHQFLDGRRKNIVTNKNKGKFVDNTKGLGRFPANIIHDGSEEVLEVFKESSRFFYCAKASKAERNMGLDDYEEKQVTDGTIRSNQETARTFGANSAKRKNYHPTVKPIKLMEYLVRLVTPKEGIVLEPFAGSGTTLIACKQQGFNYIGIEKEQEYCDIAEARLKGVKIQGELF